MSNQSALSPYVPHGLPCQAGIYVKGEVLRSLVVVVSNATDLQGYAVRALYRAFHNWSGQVFCKCLSQSMSLT